MGVDCSVLSEVMAMRRFVVAASLFHVAVMAQTMRSPMVLTTGGGYANLSTALNSPTAYAAFSIPGDGRTLNEVRFYTSAVTGTVDGANLHAMLYTSSALHPGSLVGAEDHTLPAGTISGAAWRTISGFNTALTAGAHYWIVFKNSNATSSANYPTIRAMSGSGFGATSSDYRAWGWMYRTATDNADPNLATWSTSGSGIEAAGIRLGFAAGSYAGLPVSGQVGLLKTYSGSKIGASFVAPATMDIVGVSMLMIKVGSPSGSLRYDLYQGSALVASTFAAAGNEVHTGLVWIPLYFPVKQTLTAGVRYRVVAANTDSGADDASNCFGMYGASIDSDANSLLRAPFGGTLQYAAYTGSTWSADSPSSIVPVSLFITSFGAAGGTTRVYSF